MPKAGAEYIDRRPVRRRRLTKDQLAEKRKRIAAWAARLREDGIEAAHPDGIWVNWPERLLVMFSPYFVDSTRAGTKVAIGNPDFWRVVRLGRVTEQYSLGFVQYEFREGVGRDRRKA